MMNAINGRLKTEGWNVDYVCFGKGQKKLILIPGGGDGVRTVKGMAFSMAWQFRQFSGDYRVYVISRRNDLPQGYTIMDMAEELALVMEKLEIGAADIVGVSQGGMIAQQLAVRHPEKVSKMVLAVTAPGANQIMEEALGSWLEELAGKDYKGFVLDMLERYYTEKTIRRARPMFSVFWKLLRPKDDGRLRIQLESCLNYHGEETISGIQCPCLIIGGEKDRVVGAEGSRQLAELIPGSSLYMYPEYGHGLNDEAKDFNLRILDFFREQRNLTKL